MVTANATIRWGGNVGTRGDNLPRISPIGGWPEVALAPGPTSRACHRRGRSRPLSGWRTSWAQRWNWDSSRLRSGTFRRFSSVFAGLDLAAARSCGPPAYYAYTLFAGHIDRRSSTSAAPSGVDAHASGNASGDATDVTVVKWNTSPAPLAFEVTGTHLHDFNTRGA